MRLYNQIQRTGSMSSKTISYIYTFIFPNKTIPITILKYRFSTYSQFHQNQEISMLFTKPHQHPLPSTSHFAYRLHFRYIAHVSPLLPLFHDKMKDIVFLVNGLLISRSWIILFLRFIWAIGEEASPLFCSIPFRITYTRNFPESKTPSKL